MASVGSKVKSVSEVPWTVWGVQQSGSVWVQVGVVPGREYEVLNESVSVVHQGNILDGWHQVRCLTTGEVFAVRPTDVV
jgi:hypothetical protein